MDEPDKFEAPGDAIISPETPATPTPSGDPSGGTAPELAGGVGTGPGAAILDSAEREPRRASSAAAAAGTGASTTEADIGLAVSGQLCAGLDSHAFKNSVEEDATERGLGRCFETPIRGSAIN